jgi:hypothetical protein
VARRESTALDGAAAPSLIHDRRSHQLQETNTALPPSSNGSSIATTFVRAQPPHIAILGSSQSV